MTEDDELMSSLGRSVPDISFHQQVIAIAKCSHGVSQFRQVSELMYHISKTLLVGVF